MIGWILRFEGLAVFLLSLFFYYELGGHWGLFLLLILSPDIGMLGYLKNSRIGSITYNLTHTHILSILLVTIGSLLQMELMMLLGIISFSHNGIDRFLGFGLKYPTNFRLTHFQKVS